MTGPDASSRASRGPGDQSLLFSVIVPTYDRPDQLSLCLEALAEQRLALYRFEVLVVDDGSPRSPETVVRRVANRIDVRLVRRTNGGPPAARNTGAKHARGRFLAFTDDDCRPDPGWLPSLADAFARTPDTLLGGRTVLGNPDNPYSAASQRLNTHLYEYFNGDPERASFFASNNMALPARDFRDLGGFALTPTRTAEDRELCHRWIASGRRMRFVPEAVVSHAHRLSLTGFLAQHFHYGRGAVHYHRLRAASAAQRFRLEPPSFYLGLLGAPWRDGLGVRAWPQVGLLAVSQMANAAGFFWEGGRVWTSRNGSAVGEELGLEWYEGEIP